MSGTVKCGKKAAATNKQRYGMNFYGAIGRLGGLKSRGGGFASHYVDENGMTGPERARLAGVKGGRVGRRTKEAV